MEKKDVSEKDAKRLKEAVGQLSKLVSNSICADCHQQRSLWASVNFGVFLCSRCAGMHRHLGVHITQVRSINLDTWTPIQLLCVTINGNMWTNSWLLSKKSPDYGRHIMDDPSMSRFIQDKYEHVRYGDNTGILLITKSTFPHITVEKALEIFKLAMTLHRQQIDHCLIRPRLIAAAGLEHPVPTQNPGNRKLLLCLEDSRLGEQKPITQAHISGIPQGKKASVSPSVKIGSVAVQSPKASPQKISNFIDFDDSNIEKDNAINGIANLSLGNDKHNLSHSNSLGLISQEVHNEPDWPSVNPPSGGANHITSFFKEPPPETSQSNFDFFSKPVEQNLFQPIQQQNSFTPTFSLSALSDSGIQNTSNRSSNSNFIDDIFGPSTAAPAQSQPSVSNNGLNDFVIPPMNATPFNYNQIPSTTGNGAVKHQDVNPAQDKDFILSLYNK